MVEAYTKAMPDHPKVSPLPNLAFQVMIYHNRWKTPFSRFLRLEEKWVPNFFILSRLHLETTAKSKKLWKKVGAKIVLAQSVIFRILALGPPGGKNRNFFSLQIDRPSKTIRSLLSTFFIGAIFLDLQWHLSRARMAPILTPVHFWVSHEAPFGRKTKVDSP